MTRTTVRAGLLVVAMEVGSGGNSVKSRAPDGGGWTTVPTSHDAGRSDASGAPSSRGGERCDGVRSCVARRLGVGPGVAQHQGPAKGLEAVRAIEDASRIATYPFYPAMLGELEIRSGRTEAARDHCQEARRLARNDGERRFLEQHIGECARKALS
jgi:hypothetical protein